MVTVQFLVPLGAGENDLVGIQYDDEIPRVSVTRERGFVFTENHPRNDGRETADHLVLRIDNIPLGGVRTLGFKEMRAELLRLIRLLLLQHSRLDLLEPDVLVNSPSGCLAFSCGR